MLKVNEIFLSIQGEGKYTGRPCIFLRLQGCNLNCSWCDSKHSISNITHNKSNVENIFNDIVEMWGDNNSHLNIVITGGEPLLQQEGIQHLLELLDNKYNNINIEIETNGTIVLNNKFLNIVLDRGDIVFNISPKMANSNNNNKIDNRKLFEQLKGYPLNIYYILKFVVNNENDIEDIQKYIMDNDILNDKIYIMPEGETKIKQEQQMVNIIELCKKYKYNFCPRLHVLVWDNKKGV